jgi:hypothetical protein
MHYERGRALGSEAELSIDAFEKGRNEYKGGEGPPPRKRKSHLPNGNSCSAREESDATNKKLNVSLARHRLIGVGDPVLT